MGDTSIEWATKTWGIVLGCKRVSEGCLNCYAISTAWRWAHSPNAKVRALYEGLTAHPEGERVDWTGVVRPIPGRLPDPFGWRDPERVFVNSQSDLFHPAVPVDFIAHAFAVMALTPRHTYQILTKRPDIMLKMLAAPSFSARVADAAHLIAYGESLTLTRAARTAAAAAYAEWEPAAPGAVTTRRMPWPLPNVWLGTSAEDQDTADDRIPKIVDPRLPATVRWVSLEPLLGPINLDRPRCDTHDRDEIAVDANGQEWCGECAADGWTGEMSFGHWLDPLNGGLGWVVAGGESGPSARPAHPQWFRDIRDQCADAGVPFVFKQWGNYAPTSQYGESLMSDLVVNPDGTSVARKDVDLSAVQRWPALMRRGSKKANGRLLDGRTHDDYPAAAAAQA